MKRNTILDIIALSQTRKLRMLTSYTANIARIADKIADAILVGDSLAMVLYNMPSTHNVTLEMMISHGKSVVSASSKALVIVDMPFGSYEISPEQAFESASKVIAQTGASAVKLEGGVEMAETIDFLHHRGIPVVGHVGLMPQKIHTIGSYKKISCNEKIMQDFEAVYNAGAFAIVLENVADDISNEIAEKFPDTITIGIGAGANCKGHIAVFEDLINLSTESVPHFSKPIFDVKAQITHLLEEHFQTL